LDSFNFPTGNFALSHGLPKEIVKRVQALGVKLPGKILTSLIVPFPDDRHAGHNFGIKLPSALAIILAEFRVQFDETKAKFE
jgi:hypothetical protein